MYAGVKASWTLRAARAWSGARAAERVGHTGAVVGVDVNREMVALATRLGPEVDWQVADAAALPLADASVDV